MNVLALGAVSEISTGVGLLHAPSLVRGTTANHHLFQGKLEAQRPRVSWGNWHVPTKQGVVPEKTKRLQQHYSGRNPIHE
jgi:hypothetical protein